jgi:CDP-diacylglycerol--serine O-phosphatidyltransferase
MPEPVRERRRRRRPDLRKLMIVLPSLFTVSSIFCGVYSIMLSSGETTGDNFYRAAVAIFFGNFFDAFDGRVARMTKTQSEFGVELDSLADVITFGVAPAILVYKWALYGLGFAGILIAAVYAACGAIRLARFNVLAHTEAGVQRFFVGLPIPLAAGMLVSLVIALQHQRSPNDGFALWPIAVLVLVLAFLMVSTIRYRTFKDAGLNPRTLLVFVLVIALGVVVAYRGRPSLVLLVYFSVYILLGLGEELLFGRRRRAAARAHAGAMDAGAEAEPDEPILPAEEDDVALESAPATASAGGSADDGENEP